MDKTLIEKTIIDFTANSDQNYITEQKALTKDMVGLRIWDHPIIGYASADNLYLNTIKDVPEANLNLEPPSYWLPEAKTIISFFLPFTERIRNSNVKESQPSTEWLHGRIEGQEFIGSLLKHLKEVLEEAGYKTVVPLLDSRFHARTSGDIKENEFSSNWSERHVAYAAGLGTFSLNKGIITKKGIAGRFGSLITTAEVAPTQPEYADLYEYCIMCGICAKRCPQNAISIENGKIHKPCADYLNEIEAKNPPYYGCGKCQVGVPCESQIP